jgi:hypothetical protein
MANVVRGAAQMWPRTVFDIDGGKTVKDSLKGPGVYVLFRDDQPFYVGRAKNVFLRIQNHATRSGNKHYHFWNYFSAFVVPTAKHRYAVEGVLIAAMPTANSAIPKIHKIPMPREVTQLMQKMRKKAVTMDE